MTDVTVESLSLSFMRSRAALRKLVTMPSPRTAAAAAAGGRRSGQSDISISTFFNSLSARVSAMAIPCARSPCIEASSMPLILMPLPSTFAIIQKAACDQSASTEALNGA